MNTFFDEAFEPVKSPSLPVGEKLRFLLVHYGMIYRFLPKENLAGSLWLIRKLFDIDNIPLTVDTLKRAAEIGKIGGPEFFHCSTWEEVVEELKNSKCPATLD